MSIQSTNPATNEVVKTFEEMTATAVDQYLADKILNPFHGQALIRHSPTKLIQGCFLLITQHVHKLIYHLEALKVLVMEENFLNQASLNL